MELYYVLAVTDQEKGADMAALFQAAGLRGILTMLCRGTASSEHLDVYGLEATEKAVIAAAADARQTAQLLRSAKRRLFIDIPGNGILMTIPIKSAAGARSLAYLTDSGMTGGTPRMEFEHELIIVILNEGYADFVMDAARSAGAGGGTVLHAKGTGRERAERFFGVSLADEKDMIYIVAYADRKAAIMKAINEKAGPDTRARAICFSLPISSVVGLRARDDEELPPESPEG